ncbi:MAG: ATP-dependent Clp protease ATPase subunit [Parcubacteria group bacterium GW2011_GWA2_38_13]|nr:MAG: ATP-dependent Clp protease ATPase subunit [Parcubacteria group bacterium GW2011_GWA2_38_13]
MADTEKQKNKLQYLLCPKCNGLGKINGKDCFECGGRGIGAWTGNYLLYWGKVINETHILHRKFTDAVYDTLDFLLMIFGITGIMIAFYIFTQTMERQGTSFQSFLFWTENSFRMFIVWISLITDTYLFYRFARRMEKWPKIPNDMRIIPTPDKPFVWENIRTEASGRMFDISGVFTLDAVRAIEKSYELGKKYNYSALNPIHLFISLLTFPEIINIIVRLGVPFDELRTKLSHAITDHSLPQEKDVMITIDFYKALFESFVYAASAKERTVYLSDILVGVINSSEVLSEILYDMKVDKNKIINVSLWMRFQRDLTKRIYATQKITSLHSKSDVNKSMTAVATPFLDSISEDLTLYARARRLEPCIGREGEIKEIFEIMSGGTRRSAVLVGFAGVGKETLVNKIAYLMASENVPKFLSDKRLVNLSIPRLTSGTNPAESEEKLLRLLNEVKRAGNIILFINNIHQLAGISIGSSGSMDLASVLSDAVAKKYVRLIATSSPSDYTKYIERGSLGQVFEKIDIKEVKGNEAIQILESKVGLFEAKNNVYFSYDAIAKSVELTDRYFHERYLPEKAIDVLDETASRVYGQKGKDATVTENDIAETISLKVKIPLSDITEKETEKLIHLEEKIHERMINQEEAVKMVSSALRRARAEMRDKSRPIVNLLFLGPTGVGKTQLAKTVASIYFGDEHEMIRLDMSEYQEKSSISRLIGAPPGSGDEGTSGYLTENVRNHPFSLVLLDEIEKAHPELLNIFLQVMDDGRLTDSQGRTIDFTNVILICTSNACTSTIQKRVEQNYTAQQIKDEIVAGELQQFFRPEFLNRYDGIVVFKPLSREHIRQIARVMLRDVEKNLEAKGISFMATDGAIDDLADLGYDPKFGARPMRRVIQDRVDDAVATYILEGKIQRRDKVVLDVGGKIDIIKSKKL